ncbi:MAG: LacI family DNA-binding transcriptional regulator, partial [Chloroflexi bacterium]|nr:LacI family DNA-binding transcriptional regulator [Chloroflexota bacterium]
MSLETQESNRKGRRVTVTDVASAAGVSRSTVSLVLRDSPLVKR